MGTLLEITGAQRTGIARLHGNEYYFNGQLDAKIFSRKQIEMFRRQMQTLDKTLLEIGWVPGALIELVRTTESVKESDSRLKWLLKESWVLTGYQKRNNDLRPLLTLIFPLQADILQETKHA